VVPTPCCAVLWHAVCCGPPTHLDSCVPVGRQLCQPCEGKGCRLLHCVVACCQQGDQGWYQLGLNTQGGTCGHDSRGVATQERDRCYHYWDKGKFEITPLGPPTQLWPPKHMQAHCCCCLDPEAQQLATAACLPACHSSPRPTVSAPSCRGGAANCPTSSATARCVWLSPTDSSRTKGSSTPACSTQQQQMQQQQRQQQQQARRYSATLFTHRSLPPAASSP
jgi:hypothetical protein